METWMWVTAGVVLILPVLLMLAFNGRDVADGRGRRVSAKWRTH